MQFILDCFPDAISQFGLIGCAASVLAVLGASFALSFVLIAALIGGEG